MNLNKLRDKVHQNAVAHGWWEEERSFGEIMALCHSELSEALEEYRDGKPLLYFSGKDASGCIIEEGNPIPPIVTKPEGIAVELADCIIRILDYCGKEKKDLFENFWDESMLTIELKTFGDYIAVWHLFLSKAVESQGSIITILYWLTCVTESIIDYCTKNKINIYEVLRIKHEYNKGRPYKHGGKVI